MLLIKSLAFIAFGAGIGAAIGYSQILCMNGGSCPITGSWYGGAMFGGLMGLAVSGAIGGGIATQSDVTRGSDRADLQEDTEGQSTPR